MIECHYCHDEETVIRGSLTPGRPVRIPCPVCGDEDAEVSL